MSTNKGITKMHKRVFLSMNYAKMCGHDVIQIPGTESEQLDPTFQLHWDAL